MPPPKQNCTSEDYWALPEGTRAELIDGELWDLASPSRTHQEIVLEVSVRLKTTSMPTAGRARSIPRPLR